MSYMDNEPKNDPCVSYVWRSSIPTRWVKLKGEEHFRPFNPLQRAQSNLEFLFQRLHPHKQLHKTESVLWNTQSPIRLAGKEKAQRHRMVLDGLRGASEDYGQAQDTKLMTVAKDQQTKATLHRAGKAGGYVITTIGLKLGDKAGGSGYVVHRYARPKALIPMPKGRPGDEVHSQQSAEMREFLQRFEARSRPVVPPRGRKGFNGWKLTKAKEDFSLDADISSLHTSVAEPFPFKFS